MQPLPIDAHLNEITERALESRALVLAASPGAGKTTRVPPALLAALSPAHPRLWLLEPRRIAARAAASRIAEERGWALGEEVGYQVRYENHTGPRTQLHVLTEGLLARRLHLDPQLRDVGCVVLDEFHERSWHIDLALGLLYELQQTARPDLIIVVMSATLDARLVADFLRDAPVIRVDGQAHTVQTTMSSTPQSFAGGPDFIVRGAAVLRALMDGGKPLIGDALAFLPGAGEIAAVARAIAPTAAARGFDVLPLHGGLSLDDQTRAIRKGPRPKIVLTTNIAESSVTVDGVGTVVDFGLARSMSQEADGYSRLELGRISRFSAIQRAGRAGRQGPGLCYRMWTAFDERAMPESDTPEIMRMDLSEAVLTLAAQGVSRPEGFSWIESPPLDQIESAQRRLRAIGAIDDSGAVTAEGRAMLSIPLAPRLAKLALEGARRGSAQLAAGLCAVLSEKDLLREARDGKKIASGESDPLARLWLLDGEVGASVDPGTAARTKRAREQIRRAAERAAEGSARDTTSPGRLTTDEDEAKYLLFIAFSDQLARRRRPGGLEARIVGGRGAKLSSNSCCEQAELFVCARATEIARGGAIRPELIIEFASAVEKSWITQRFPERVQRTQWTEWDDESGQALSYSAMCYQDLPLEAASASRATSDEAFALLVDATLERWDATIARNADAVRLVARMRFVRDRAPDFELPDPDSLEFRKHVAEALAYGETKRDAVEKKSWLDALSNALGRKCAAVLDREAPAFFSAPSGSQLPIDYPPGQTPFVEVRIQEIFGLRVTPRIGSCNSSLQMQLLAPNFRPVQVTQDLESFWKSGYLEVRKELRARYPRHSWPEDPQSAKPEAKGRRKR